MNKILITEPTDLPIEAMGILRDLGTVVVGPVAREELMEQIVDVTILMVRLGHAIDADVLNAAKHLKVIVTATTGLNHIDLDVAKSKNIEVLSLRGETEFLETISPTADLTFGLLLSLTRHIPSAVNSVIAGQWNRDDFKGIDLRGKTLGLYGFGRIGRKVARMALAFDMKVIAYDIQPKTPMDGVVMVDEADLLSVSDILSLHVLHTAELDNFFNESKFAAMKQGAYFINSARGELVDESALLNALQARKLSGAALDVISGEQEFSKDSDVSSHPLIQYAASHPHLMITPHIGGASIDSMRRVEFFMTEKLQKFLQKGMPT